MLEKRNLQFQTTVSRPENRKCSVANKSVKNGNPNGNWWQLVRAPLPVIMQPAHDKLYSDIVETYAESSSALKK